MGEPGWEYPPGVAPEKMMADGAVWREERGTQEAEAMP